jgi:hypothetical protein
MIRRASLCAASLLLAAAAPERAPARFTTHDYQLTVNIPPGLFHCPSPPGWTGADHGISLYLARPSACDAETPAAAEAEAGQLPQIRFYYVSNGVDMGGQQGAIHPPQRNLELHQLACGEAHSAWPPPMTMLGVTATTCFEHRDDTISLAAGTLYRQTMTATTPPDSQAWLILQTSARRYPYDLKIFQAILKTIAVCRSKDRPPEPPRPACPPAVRW